jgi:hypothetical protein
MDTSRIARWHLLFALTFAVLGMCLGIYMAVSQNHTLHPAHAHILLIGFVISALYAMIYRLWVTRGRKVVAVVQAALREVGAVLLGGSLMLLYGGVTPEPALGPFLGVGAISVLTAVVMIIIQVLGADPAAR